MATWSCFVFVVLCYGKGTVPVQWETISIPSRFLRTPLPPILGVFSMGLRVLSEIEIQQRSHLCCPQEGHTAQVDEGLYVHRVLVVWCCVVGIDKAVEWQGRTGQGHEEG